LRKFEQNDAEIIVKSIQQAVATPIEKEYDEKKYEKAIKPSTLITQTNTPKISEKEPLQLEKSQQPTETATTHEEMEGLLLKAGISLGFDVWVARNDRSKQHEGIVFQNMPHVRNEIPIQFDAASNKIIELIDVIWLEGDSIQAAFEVEHTSTIYSGLLRLSDLITRQPNLSIDLYIVAPDDRRDKVISEVNRPTFANLKKPLAKICRFLPYSHLKAELAAAGERIKFMNYKFIVENSESLERK
jgi:hypothetical protein